MVERAIAWSGGVMFVVSLAITAWTYAARLGEGHQPFDVRALIFDAGLVGLFAVHHSLFARTAVKTQLVHIVPPRLLRSAYVWVASALLILVCLLWRPLGGELYNARGLGQWLSWVVQLTGVALVVAAARAIDPLELAGIHDPAARDPLQIRGPYGLVRHPLYLGWVLIVFGIARMTGDRMAFALLTTGYIVAAIPWEESDLRRTFGLQYEQYMQRVRWRLIPFVF